MTYAKRILSILLVLCLLGNTAITVFASDTDGGGEELPPVDAATEEPAPEGPPPEQGEEPPSEPSDEEDPTVPEESTPPDEEEAPPTEEEAPPTESSDEEAAPDELTEDVPPEESPEDAEEVTEPPLEEVPAEEIVVTDDAEMTAEITAANDIVLPKGVTGKLEHCGNAILTDGVAGGTVRLTYESYLAGAEVTAYFSFVEEKRLNGVVAYCIEPEVAAQNKTYTEAEQEDAWNKMPPNMRQAIVLAIAYGYPQVEYSADPNDIYYKQTGSSNKQNMLNGENYIATQLIIWEFLCGRRDCDSYQLTGASLRNVCDGGWATIRTTYDAIVTKLLNHNAIPAYASRSQNAYVYELKYNKATGTYRYMLPAERQSTKRNCDIQLPTGVSYLYASDGATVIGFEATVAAAESLLKNGFTASGETPSVSVDPNQAVTCWTCNGSQTVVTTMETKPDPAKAYFTLKLAKAGSLTGLKTTSVPNGSVAGFCFKFYSWTDNREWYAKTDANGNLCLSDSNYSTLGTTQITGLSEGKYDMLEVLGQDSLIFPDSWTVTVTDANGNIVSSKTYTPTKESSGNYAIRNVEITGLAAGGTVTMTINNAPTTAPLEIKKTSTDGKIEGITFYVLDASGKEIGRDVTDAKGIINIKGLAVGQTYTVYEIVPEGYVCTQNPKQITIQAGTDTNTVTFENKPLVLKLIKQSPDGNTKNITFQIFAGDDDYATGTVWQTLSTGLDGSFTITGIPAGDYWFREVPLTGYAVQPDQKVTVTEKNTEDNPAVVTFVNVPVENLKIVKTSPNGNVKDIEFYVTDASGKEVGRDVTDKNGELVFPGLVIGQTYTVTEVVPNGSVCENNNQKITIQKGTNTLTFVNTYVETLKIVKTSPNGNVKDIEFYVTDASGKEVGRDVTDENGELVFPGLAIGQTYTVTEVVPKGSVCENNNQKITIQKGTNTLTFVNKPLVLKIIKESADGNTSNIPFVIFAGDRDHTNGRIWKTAKTDANGTWEITGIPAGVYWVRENVPEGYTKQADQRIEVTTANTEDNPAVVTFVNKPITLKIIKQSPDGNNEGIPFQIFKSDQDHINNNVWQTVVTGEGGSITLEKLTPGTYWVREVVPEGYASQEDQSVTVTTDNTPENPAVVTFVNVPLSALKVVKTSPDGNVEGITFQLFEGDFGHNTETVFAEGKTDADGVILFTNLDTNDMLSRGVYWVREIVPEGYAPQEDQRIVVTTANTPVNPAVVTFENIPLYGSISVNKVNTADTPLAGATFLLEYSTDDGATWTAVKPATEEENGIGTCSTVGENGMVTTGEDGQAKFENLIVYGVAYRLTETVAPAGYQLLAEPVFTGEITANEEDVFEIYLTVVNAPLLQMPPTGGDGGVRIIGMVSTLVSAASICVLTLLLRKRKENG